MSNALTRAHIAEFIAAHPQEHFRAIGVNHDRDPGTEVHGHVFFYDSRTARAEAAVRRMFSVPVVVTPYIIHPGEPGSDRGKFAMARAARYCTHEHPEQQALGKALYTDAEQIASRGWDWRADVDQLNAYERVDPTKPAKLTMIQQLEDRVRAGELTARDVYRRYPDVYRLKPISHWNSVQTQGERWRRDDHMAVLIAKRDAEGQSRREAAEAERAARVAARERRDAEFYGQPEPQPVPEALSSDLIAALAWDMRDAYEVEGLNSGDLDGHVRRAVAEELDRDPVHSITDAAILNYVEAECFTLGEDEAAFIARQLADMRDEAGRLAQLEKAASSGDADARDAAADLRSELAAFGGLAFQE